jgi:hypothetical protein
VARSTLAKKIVSLLAPLSFEEALEVTKIHSIPGLLPANQALVATRPYGSPHHSVSDAGLIRGGSIPKLGEVRQCSQAATGPRHGTHQYLEELRRLSDGLGGPALGLGLIKRELSAAAGCELFHTPSVILLTVELGTRLYNRALAIPD